MVADVTVDARSPESPGTRAKKQLKIFVWLMLALAVIICSPGIRLGLGMLLPRESVKAGAAIIPIPRGWRLSRSSTRSLAWKSCLTILCGSAIRAQISIEPLRTGVPAGVWEHAAQRIMQRDFSRDPTLVTIDNSSGQISCFESNLVNPNDNVMASCISANLGFTTVFIGNDSMRPEFHAILRETLKAP